MALTTEVILEMEEIYRIHLHLFLDIRLTVLAIALEYDEENIAFKGDL